ncbi:uncharacterized protein K02A2.6-like [Haliotis rufescens]|uniref:uncharacterized protein K02A2.6-like n=1 Tax=Haliotis rufescens TaxID=6454 RepID=UPI00201F316F|nr:uncharacterized protein K02A2.6-like [Haliotis rufescens]
MVTVVKPHKTRICIDPKDLNRAVKREHYPMRTVEEIMPHLPGAKIFTVLDAESGFWQIKLDQESSKLCTFNTPYGRYRFTRLPFGVKSAPEVFQRTMSQLLEGLTGAECIVDDVLVWGIDVPQHDERLYAVLNRIQSSGLKLNRSKCKLRMTEVSYVGHLLTKDGLKPDPEKFDETEFDVNFISQLPLTSSRVETFKLATADDPQLPQLKSVILIGWSLDRKDVPACVQDFWNIRDELAVVGDLVFKGNKLVVPRALQAEMLEKIHEAHLGITKCKQRARDVLFWIGMNKHIEDFVSQCTICNENKKSRGGRYPEIVKLTDWSSKTTITALKSVFARHGIPDEIMTDNGPQFSSTEFRRFSQAWEFTHRHQAQRIHNRMVKLKDQYRLSR